MKKFYEFVKSGILEGCLPLSEVDVDLSVTSALESDWQRSRDFYEVSEEEAIETVQRLEKWIADAEKENR